MIEGPAGRHSRKLRETDRGIALGLTRPDLTLRVPDLNDRRTALPARGLRRLVRLLRLLDAIAGPDKGKGSRRKKEMLTWCGGPYNPDDIDEKQIRAALKRIANIARRGRAKTADA